MGSIVALNHAAVITEDLDRFIDFYRSVFDLELVFAEDTPAFRHAILRAGEHSWLHPVCMAGNPHGTASEKMLSRGHLDHVALTAASREHFAEIRQRLIDRDATNGEIEDFGGFWALWFQDPDGMHAEVVLVVDHTLAEIHAPRPLPQPKFRR